MIIQDGTTLEDIGKGPSGWIDWDKIIGQIQKPGTSKICIQSLCPNGKARDENCQCPVHGSYPWQQGSPSFWDKLKPIVRPYGPQPWTGPGAAPTFPAPPSALAIAQKKLKEAKEAEILAEAERTKKIAEAVAKAAAATAARESERALRERAEFAKRDAEARAAEAAAAAQIATDAAKRQAQIILDIKKDKMTKYIPYAAAAVGLGLAFYMLKK
jgi:hypothetical protein